MLPELNEADTICKRDDYILGKPLEDVKYKWNTGDTVCCIRPNVPGKYVLTVSNGCEEAVDSANIIVAPCEKCLIIPTAFSPNADGRNDLFNIHALCPVTRYTIRIFDRWGEEVFVSSSMQNSWDGMFKGKPMELGTYYYTIAYMLADGMQGFVHYEKGDVTLVR